MFLYVIRDTWELWTYFGSVTFFIFIRHLAVHVPTVLRFHRPSYKQLGQIIYRTVNQVNETSQKQSPSSENFLNIIFKSFF